MDAPIYIYIPSYYPHSPVKRGQRLPIRNRLYVIGEGIDVAAGSGEEVFTSKPKEEEICEGIDGAAAGETSKSKEEEERVRVLNLPDSEDTYFHSGLIVAESHMFIFGGVTVPNGISYVSLQKKDPSWVKSSTGFVKISEGGEIIHDYVGHIGGRTLSVGDRMAGFGWGGRMFSFRTPSHDDDVDLMPKVSFLAPPAFSQAFPRYPDDVYPVVIAVTLDRKMLMFWSGSQGFTPGVLGYYDLDLWPWNTDMDPSWKTIDDNLNWPSYSSSAVLVRDRYLILFAYSHPTTEAEDSGMYVYDTITHKWCLEPVQGLPTLPKLRFPGIQSEPSSLMQVGAERLAFVWSNFVYEKKQDSPDCCQINWVKFTLIINNETDPPTFHAQRVSSHSFLADGFTIDVTITTVPLSLGEALMREHPKHPLCQPDP